MKRYTVVLLILLVEWSHQILNEHFTVLKFSNLDGKWEQPHKIVLDSQRKRLFWTELTQKKISSCDYNGTNMEDILQLFSTPVGLMLDTETDELYFSTIWDQFYPGRVSKVDLRNGNLEDLFALPSLYYPTTLAADKSQNLLFWASGSVSTTTVPKIQRAEIDGKHGRNLVTDSKDPRAVVFDSLNQRIIWTDACSRSINSVTTDGSDRKILVEDLGEPTDIVLVREKLYYCDQLEGRIMRMNLDGTGLQEMSKNLNRPSSLAVDELERVIFYIEKGSQPPTIKKISISEGIRFDFELTKTEMVKEGSTNQLVPVLWFSLLLLAFSFF